MTRLPTVAVFTGHAWVLIDYRTGRTELRRVLPDGLDPLLAIRHEHDAGSWGTKEVNAILKPPVEAGVVWLLAVAPAVAVTAAVQFLGSRSGRFARMVRLACAGRRLPPATHVQAQHAVHAVRRISALLPARWACLEQSVAAAVLLVMAGRRAEWRHGIATDPIRLHAWIEADGHAVGEDFEIGAYTPIYTPDGPSNALDEISETDIE